LDNRWLAPKFLKITGINRGEPDQCSGYSVVTARGSKTTQLGGSSAESLARIMLRELADEGKA
jgi:hypothetical protein